MKQVHYFLRAAGWIAAAVFAVSALAEAPAPKPAASAPNPLSQKYDTKLPIEISSDTLEVMQHESKAIFKGDVIAVQGKIRLKADTMIVHYRQKPGQAQPPAPAGAAPPPASPREASSVAAATGAMGAISLIEVEGNVFMATPEESAKGDKGDYQVDQKLLHLTGDNVVLTRDKNILRGTELVYNLETGQSVLTNHGSKIGGSNGGRVRGVFVPNQQGGKAKDAKKKPAADAAPMQSQP